MVFVLQLACGYLLMLVAMTYQLELFVAIVAGLGAGHSLFNLRSAANTTDPCCPSGEETEMSARMSIVLSPDDLSVVSPPHDRQRSGGGTFGGRDPSPLRPRRISNPSTRTRSTSPSTSPRGP